MSKFVVEKTVEVTLADGDHVWVWERLNAGQSAVLSRHMMHVRFDAESRQMVVDEGDWHRNRIEICKAYITRWDFKDDADPPQLVPYAPSLVETLAPDVVAEIAQVIDDLQAKLREGHEKKGKSR